MCKEPEEGVWFPRSQNYSPPRRKQTPLLFRSTTGHLSAINNHFQSAVDLDSVGGSDHDERSCSSIGTLNCHFQILPCSSGQPFPLWTEDAFSLEKEPLSKTIKKEQPKVNGD